MKKYFALLTAILLTLLSSCTEGNVSPSPDSQQYTDNYLYTQIGGVLHRISTVTASVTPVCPDPLCEHADASCPFFGVENIRMAGQYMYYLKGISMQGGYEKLCRFDMKSGKYEELYEAEDCTLNHFFANEDFVFFNCMYFDQDLEITYHLMRYDIDKRKAVRLTEEPNAASHNPVCIEGDRIYWSGDDVGYYSTDLNYENKKSNDRGYSPSATMGDYSFRMESAHRLIGYENYQTNAMKLTRIDITTGEETIVFEELGSVPIFYNGKIIYQKLDELRYVGDVQESETGNWIPRYDKYGGKYYICDSDGSNERLLCDISDTLYVSQISSNILGGKRGVGDWIAVWVQAYVPVEETDIKKIRRIDNAYLLINIETGEVKITEYGTHS